MVEITRKWFRERGEYEYRWEFDGIHFGEYKETEAQAMFDYVLMRLEDLSNRIHDLEGAKANG